MSAACCASAQWEFCDGLEVHATTDCEYCDISTEEMISFVRQALLKDFVHEIGPFHCTVAEYMSA